MRNHASWSLCELEELARGLALIMTRFSRVNFPEKSGYQTGDSWELRMSIRPFIHGIVFEPHDIQVMSMAYDDVCKALNLPNTDKHAREVIAARIIELARRGERSLTALRDRVLTEANAAKGFGA